MEISRSFFLARSLSISRSFASLTERLGDPDVLASLGELAKTPAAAAVPSITSPRREE